jgi:hypothetical protein
MVARASGTPAVVAQAGATKRIPTGNSVPQDGNVGTIVIEPNQMFGGWLLGQILLYFPRGKKGTLVGHG